jgi:hypothetical protein
MRRPTLAATLAAAMLLVSLAIAPVAAKTAYEARLDAPISRDAAPGATITVRWTVDQVVGFERVPIEGPGPVFLRLYPMTRGAAPTEAIGDEPLPDSGRFTASIEVPAGGVARVEIGLFGESCTAGVCTRYDELFPVVGDVLVSGPGIGSEPLPVTVLVAWARHLARLLSSD